MKKTLFLSIFIFGWLVIFDACTQCPDHPSNCYNITSVDVVAYNYTSGGLLNSGDLIKSNALVLDIVPWASQRFCMVPELQMGNLLAFQCVDPMSSLDVNVRSISVTSNTDIAPDYVAGSDLSGLMESIDIEIPEDGMPLQLKYDNSAPEELVQYVGWANYELTYVWANQRPSSTRVIRFREDVNVAPGDYVFTIQLILKDDTVFTTTTVPLRIQS